MKYILPLLCVFLLSCTHSPKTGCNPELLQTTPLPHYPSASSVALVGDRLYVIGDDAPYLLVLDRDHRPVDSLRLFESATARIPKPIKADLESSAFISIHDTGYLYAISSFSTPARNRVLCLATGNDGPPRLIDNRIVSLHLPAVSQLNIEGAAFVQDRLVLSNRANTTNTVNQLLVTRLVNGIPDTGNSTIIPLMLPGITKTAGISGLHYVAEKDLLLFSASTEDTPNAYTDGTVGESYIGYIRAFSTRWHSDRLTADTLIPLSPCLGQSLPQKIESITAEPLPGNMLEIHLAADNDNGQSMLYKMRWQL